MREVVHWEYYCGAFGVRVRRVIPSRVEAIERLGIGKGSHRREGATYWEAARRRTAAAASSWVAWPVARLS